MVNPEIGGLLQACKYTAIPWMHVVFSFLALRSSVHLSRFPRSYVDM